MARDAGTIVVSGNALPGSADTAADEKRRTARKDAKVSAALHTESPVRFWDHDLGPDELRLFALAADGTGEARDLTPAPGRALDETAFAVTPDGSLVITSWNESTEPGYPRPRLIAVDTATGEQRELAADPSAGFEEPAVSPDGRRAVAVRWQDNTYDDPPLYSLWLVDLDTGEGRELVVDADIWPGSPTFAPDGETIYFLADEAGHRPVFRLDIASGAITRVTASGHYDKLLVAPDGATLYALRDAVDSPPRPVRLDAAATDGEPTYLPAPGAAEPAGRLERVDATAKDGTTVEAWLVLPPEASADAPAPLLLWIHGGPLGSWNGWSWRWNPWLMAAKGYAVLLPDPALSTGYGAKMIARGWGQWGGAPYTDLMAVTDSVVGRAGHRPHAHGRDGRLLRRLHGELGGRAHRPIPLHRHAREPLGAGPVLRHHRCARILGEGVRRADRPAGALCRVVAAHLRPRHPDADARHPRRQGLPRAGRRGPAAVVGSAARRRRVGLPVLPGRGSLDPQAGQRPGLVRHGLGVARQARARRRMAAAGPALTTRAGPANRYQRSATRGRT